MLDHRRRKSGFSRELRFRLLSFHGRWVEKAGNDLVDCAENVVDRTAHKRAFASDAELRKGRSKFAGRERRHRREI